MCVLFTGFRLCVGRFVNISFLFCWICDFARAAALGFARPVHVNFVISNGLIGIVQDFHGIFVRISGDLSRKLLVCKVG